LARYDLEHGIGDGDIEQHLLARWRGEGKYSETGLRPLKDWLNKQLLKSVYTEHDRSTLGNRIDADYDALSDDDTDFALLDDLEMNGIDGKQLQADFLSTTTLYRHFTNCLAATKSTQSSDSPGESAWEAEKVEYATDIVERNVEESLRSLENKDRVPEASRAKVKTEIVLGCPDCATQVSFERAVGRGYVCQDHMVGDSSAGHPDEAAPASESK
jgi:hypothetical protein